MRYFLLIIFLFIGFSSYSQIVNIPDLNFKQALLDHDPLIDINNDNEIQLSEAQVVDSLYVFGSNINSMVGIEAFKDLEILYCGYNYLTELNLSQNIDLIKLVASNNDLTSLDISANPNLEHLDINENFLDNLNTTNNVNLEHLNCDFNEIETIDLNQNTLLEYVSLGGNLLTSIDTSQNLSLEFLAVNFNLLESLDVSFNINLEDLDCSENFDLSSLNIANGNNQNLQLSAFSCNLSCIQADSNIIDNIPQSWDYDPGVYFCEDCSAPNCELSDHSYNQLNFLILPNPFSNQLYIQSSNSATKYLSIKIFDINGKLMFQSKELAEIYDFSKFSKGLYFVFIFENDQKVFSKKIIKE